MKFNSKGQAGLDFLMTYGWALLLIVLVVGALFALGIFDVGKLLGSRASGFTNVGVTAWRVTSAGAVTMILRNQAGAQINVTNVATTLSSSSVIAYPNITIDNGKTSASQAIGTLGSVPAAGSSYTMNVTITYVDVATTFQYTSAGTLTGIVG